MDNPYLKTLEPAWKHFQYVDINELKLKKLIAEMRKQVLSIPAWDIPYVHPPKDCKLELWIDFVCWINTVNFAFTRFEAPHNKFTVEYPAGSFCHGAFAMQAAFMRAYSEGLPVFNAKYMANISLKAVKRIFRAIDADHEIPMVDDRHYILRQVGETLQSKYGGSWYELFSRGGWRAFEWSGSGIVERLVRDFVSFRDQQIHNGKWLEFHKRAQLLVMMYHGRAVNSGRMPVIKDIENIGPIADYEVPRALRHLGVLEWSCPLLEIRPYEVVSSGDPRVIETRVATSYVMARICEEAKCNMAQADYYIWSLGRKAKEPHMLVRTTAF